jgi:indolepyruvate decarboxylase
MGFAVPASLGLQLANPRARPLVLVGDGAFQMTGMEISSVLRYGLNPIVVVLNNRGFGTERPMQDGPYNDVAPWQYHRVPEVVGGGRGFLVRTEADLCQALGAAAKYKESFSLLEVLLDPNDHSPALQRLTQRLAKRI